MCLCMLKAPHKLILSSTNETSPSNVHESGMNQVEKTTTRNDSTLKRHLNEIKVFIKSVL